MIDSQPDGRRAGRPAALVSDELGPVLRRMLVPDQVGDALLRALDGHHLRGGSQSLEEMAERLNEMDPTPPRPGAPGERWTASAVRNALRAVRTQRLVLLRRMGSLLAAVAAHEPIATADLVALGRHHQVDVYWLWDRFQLGDAIAAPPEVNIALSAPVEIAERHAGIARLSDDGRQILRYYDRLREFPEEVQEVARFLWWYDGDMHRNEVRRYCRLFGARFDDLFELKLAEQRRFNRVVATDLGISVGLTWVAIGGDDPTGRWDCVFQPDAGERANLPADWDWDDRPVLPPR
jgi:hypothetical protein